MSVRDSVKKILDRLKLLLKENPHLQRIFRDTSYLFSSNTLNMVLGVIQSSLSATLLGVYNFGLLGIVTASASTVNNLFSFRMSEIIVKYLGDFLEEKDYDRAGALIKAAALVEFTFALMAFFFIWWISPILAQHLAKDPAMQSIFVFYGMIILANGFYETSYGVVQVLGRFRGQAIINSVQSIVTAILIVITFIMKGGLDMIVFSYLVGKIILGIGPVFLAFDGLNHRIGKRWWRVPISALPNWRELIRFSLGANLSATINMVVRDSELLWISYFLSPAEAGYYKVAIAINRYILLPINPFIQTTFPEINRRIKNRAWPELQKFLRQISSISLAWTIAAGFGLVIFGEFVIRIYADVEFAPAYPAMLILLIGYGLANIFFWNRSLLLSFGDSTFAFLSMFVAGFLKIAGAFWLVPKYGFLAEAGLFSLFFVVSVSMNLLRGRFRIREGQKICIGSAAPEIDEGVV